MTQSGHHSNCEHWRGVEVKLRRYFDASVLANVSAAILVGLSVSSVSLAETPVYEFRGFDSNSTCDDVRDREIRHGGELSSYEKKDGARLWAYYIDSYLFGFDTTIVISCGSNRHATSIRYQVVYCLSPRVFPVFTFNDANSQTVVLQQIACQYLVNHTVWKLGLYFLDRRAETI